MCTSVFIALPKILETLECNKHRTISIIDVITKIIVKALLGRIRSKIRPEISRIQFGFVRDKSTRKAILFLQILIEMALEMQKSIYLCFVDYGMVIKVNMRN